MNHLEVKHLCFLLQPPQSWVLHLLQVSVANPAKEWLMVRCYTTSICMANSSGYSGVLGQIQWYFIEMSFKDFLNKEMLQRFWKKEITKSLKLLSIKKSLKIVFRKYHLLSARWVKFSPKLGVNTSKFGERLAYWPITALLFLLFYHFFSSKSLKITVIFPGNKF